MAKQILILGATGMLGQPVTYRLAKMGFRVRALVRNREKALQMFGYEIEMVQGSALNKEDIQAAMAECDAVHLSLSQKSPNIIASSDFSVSCSDTSFFLREIAAIRR